MSERKPQQGRGSQVGDRLTPEMEQVLAQLGMSIRDFGNFAGTVVTELRKALNPRISRKKGREATRVFEDLAVFVQQELQADDDGRGAGGSGKHTGPMPGAE
jgi:hypothetical protein